MKVISIESIKAERRNSGLKVQHAELTKPLQELITSGDAGSVRQKIVLDVEEGRLEVPLLYKPVFSTRVNRDFPKFVDTNFITSAACVFLQHLEAGEIEFGAMSTGVPGVVPILTWASAFEYTEDMVEFNQSWQFEELNRAFGEAYNALLNHLHLGPVLSFAYAAANQTAATNLHTDFLMEVRETLQTAIRKCTLAQRTPTIILASIADKFNIEDALNLNQDPDANNRNIVRLGPSIEYLIYYDGWDVTVGPKTYSYPGVTPGTCYLIRPQKFMIELEKHGLLIDSDNADISRLIMEQYVGRTRRGVYIDIERSVEEVTLPTS